MTIKLIYNYKNQVEKAFSSTKHEIIIGRPRNKDDHLDLSPDTRVSRPHARLFYYLSTWFIEDLGSKHGTKLNGKQVTTATVISPNDQLQVGDTILRVELAQREPALEPGMVESHFSSNESHLLTAVTEDKRLEVLFMISRIAAHSHGQAMLEGFMREIEIAFPQAERRTILLIQDRELIPAIFWPPDQAHASFTLTRQVIQSKMAIRWQQSSNNTPNTPESLLETASALYAPLLCNGQVIGAIHIDSTSASTVFDDADLQLLSIIANTMGSAIQSSICNVVQEFPSVFISYPLQDRPFTDRLAASLRRHRIKVWFDARLRSGTERCEQIETAIQNTGAFLQVCSPQTAATEEIEWEIKTAQTTGKKIFRLLLPDCKMPDNISTIQCINFKTTYEEGVLNLVHELYDMPRQPSGEFRKEKNKMRILFLAANPLNTKQLHLSEEERTIDERLRMAEFRDRFEFLSHWAVRPADLSELLLRYKPHIVHFSGHGNSQGEVILENSTGEAKPVSPDAIRKLFHILKDNIRCVVLNACWTAIQAQAIVQEIDCVVGMSRFISNQAAILFAGGLYRGLGYGRNVQTAFDLGCSEIDLEDLDEESIPKLLIKPGVDASQITFV
ncbi:MAG: TIR domain-containing protein [Anaerolineales bacterium]|nr:TIR domain-containing protein [Anaerolineales bacterium]